MITSEELLDSLRKSGDAIQAIIRNFKKDPAERKTNVSYYEERLRRLTEAWNHFEAQDTKLRTLADAPRLRTEHEYFTDDYYTKINEITNTYVQMFSVEMSRLKALEKQKSVADEPSTLQVQPTEIQHNHTKTNPEEFSKASGVVRGITARLTALDRILNGIADRDDQPVQYYKLKVSAITKAWDQIEALHYEAHEKLLNPVAAGLNQNEYDSIYDAVQEKLVNLSVKIEKLQHNTNPTQSSALTNELKDSPLHLPKVTIPQFNGDYLKWRQFHDMFSEMVDKQPIPAIQKMWYLKSNVSGEAEHLITQFSLSEENYSTAWNTLKERYNNKRVLVSNLVERILSQPAVTSSASSIKTLHDTTKECLLALNNLGIPTASWDAILIQLLMKKLDKSTHIRYIQSLKDPKDIPQVVEFLSFLELQFQSMEAISQREEPRRKAVLSVASSAINHLVTCKMCNNGNHQLFHCDKFRQLSEAERLRWVQQQKLCVNCFKKDHSAKTCTSGRCKSCSQKHNTLVHLPKRNSNEKKMHFEANTKTKTPSVSEVAVATVTANNVTNRQGFVLLATARVIITASNGMSGEFRAILDSGSQVNIVSERLVKRLSVSPTESSLCIDGVGKQQKRASHRVAVIMKSRDQRFVTNLEAYILPTIIPAQPDQQIDISSWSIPKGIQLADPHFYKQEKIDILLGAEFFFSLIQPGTIRPSNHLPIFQNTSLGWVVAGLTCRELCSAKLNTTICAIFDELSLEEAIEQLWKMDEVESHATSLSPAEKLCESHFVQHVNTNDDGRFIVKIPFKENPEVLGDSHALAFNRFLGLERRLQKNADIREKYIEFMQQYIELGHMQKIDISALPGPKYFIPHHSVMKPDSSTTKLRVVFDASAKTSSGYSLNDLMYTGPTVQGELFSILLRFRLPRFVFTTDIEKMYRQILIHPDDRQYQLIIWREDQSQPIHYYKLNTVTYGLRAAPYLATRCLQKIAEENELNYPNGAQMLKHNFYVDDGLGGADYLSVATTIQKELITILGNHGFVLKKWCANHPELLKGIPAGDQEVNLDFNSANTNTVKTLGILWLPKTDEFCIRVKLDKLRIVSKRSATSDLAKLFDPLGLLAPVVVKAKMFIQRLWQYKLDWDEPLSEDLYRTWSQFRNELESLNNLKIPRHIYKAQLPGNTQLHIFADASEKAFGAVAYLRARSKDGRLIVQLLCAKTRVAPLKQQTLPRLELCAAVLAAQLANRIKTDLCLKNQPTLLWTDSEIVLSWINTQSSLYQTFVANRIAMIQSLTLPDQWRHVPSKHNPADILSRGLSAIKLHSCNLWFYGPLFLHGGEDTWPPIFSQKPYMNNEIEKKKTALIAISTTSSDDFIYTIEHNNSFRRLQRILGYVHRFIKNSKVKHSDRPTHRALTPAELEESLITIVRAIQSSDFSSEISQLNKNNEVDKKSSIVSLAPFLDKQKILRVGGRLEASMLSYDAKHQMLLPYNDPLVKLLFRMAHEENSHCGPQTLLSIIRQRFWPIRGKVMARSTVQKCIRCTKAQPQLCQQLMGNLPKDRVTPARPFVNAGVDYCGPFWIHYRIRGKKPTKAYIAVFCCFATKAIHLELVSDLTTEAFIGALKRFISRRGRCQNIYSDNATNFVGAKNQLSELSNTIHSEEGQELIISNASSKGIQFHFIPPRAPHFGGLWEAAVKSAKYLLLRGVAAASLTQEELETIVIEIEAILNSRPLSPMSDDPNNLEVLTPGHFLIGEALTSQIDSKATPISTSKLSHWKLLSQIKYEFWRRWSSEYLNELQQRHKWNKQRTNLKIGDMVIMKEDNMPIMKWPLARIVQTYPGNDGVVRVVEVKTANGQFKRSIHRLALLPTESDPEVNTIVKTHNELINKSIPDSHEEPRTKKFINKSIPDSHEEPKTKKQKIIKNQLNLALIAMLFLLPTMLGAPVKNQRFGSKVGIHFEQLGTISRSSTEWNLLVYYDLTPYWAETSVLINGTRSLISLCHMMKPNTSCLAITAHFKYIEGELQLENQLLRSKRGAIDVVGNVAHSLFGILDSEYANQMSETIQRVKENESYLLTLLKNQTSIVDSTINIMKQNQVTSNARFKHLEQEIETFSREIDDIENIVSQIQLSQLFNSAALELNLIATNMLKIQTSILDTLIDTHHGKISPLLLSPQQLTNEITQIKLHMPASVKLPATGQEELLKLFKIMKVKSRLTHQHAVFKITLPLIDDEEFELYHLTPIPNVINNTLVAIKPCSDFLGINTHRQQFIYLSRSELNSCDTLNPDIFLCFNIQIRHNYGSEACACEINLFNNKPTPNCNIIATNTRWVPLNKQNQWIYSMLSTSQATAVCNKEIISITLKGSGLLTLEPECMLKHKFATMTGRQAISTTVKSSYTSLGRLSDVSLMNTAKYFTKEQSNSTNYEALYAKNLQELDTLQRSLQEHGIIELPDKLNSHQQHSYTISYLACFLSIVALIIIIRMCKAYARILKLHPTMPEESNNHDVEPQHDATPLPMPRTQRSFTVAI